MLPQEKMFQTSNGFHPITGKSFKKLYRGRGWKLVIM